MIKLICLINRPDGMSATAFRQWWLGHHAHLAMQLPGLRRYTISTVQDDATAPFDGVAELWFDSKSAMEAAFTSNIGIQVAREDRDMIGKRIALTAEEHTIL